MPPQIVAALIAALVSILGVAISIASARWSVVSARERILAEAAALQQNLLKDVLAKRMEAYAALWKVMITYDLNWLLERKQLDRSWAAEFLRELNVCNAEHGVFFSQPVYERFVEYRACLAGIVEGSRISGEISMPEVERLANLAKGTNGHPGLATALKNDLGSYVRINLQV